MCLQCRRCRRQIQSLGGEDPLEKEKATHSSILAQKIPWTEEPGGLQSMRSLRVGGDLVADTCTQLLYNVMFASAAQKREPALRIPVCYVVSAVSGSLWPLDCGPPGSSVRGILQARMLEWAAMPSSRASSPPRDRIRSSCELQADSSPLSHQGSPICMRIPPLFWIPLFLKSSSSYLENILY